MGVKTGIAWCDSTWNPIIGCSPISEGCKHCWASAIVTRFPNLNGGKPFSNVIFHQSRRDQVKRWKRPRRIFVGGMTDLYHDKIDSALRREIFAVMEKARQHTYMLLTKRPMTMRHDQRIWQDIEGRVPARHIWLGVTVENQQRANERIPILLDTPAAIRWLSVEPLLEPLTLRPFLKHGGLSFCVIGCESGPGRRPMKLEWAEALVAECRYTGVACFVKQLEIDGKVVHDIERFPKSLQVRERPK